MNMVMWIMSDRTIPRSLRFIEGFGVHTFRLINKEGKGGDTHQVADKNEPVLTTQMGIPIADDQNTLKAYERGPVLLEDFIFREKIFHFDHERIPERVVHARGYGAHGYFETYDC